MERKKTIKEQMLEHFRLGLGLTPLSALNFFGCLSLSQRISELRAQGYTFTEKWKKLENGKKVKEFFLAKEAA